MTINNGALFNLLPRGNRKLAPATVFTVIKNTSTKSIKGQFANLADGATISLKSNELQVSYERGDGNDLTLTVAQ